MPNNAPRPITRLLLVGIATILVCATCIQSGQGGVSVLPPFPPSLTVATPGSQPLPPIPDAPFILSRDSATLIFLGTVHQRNGASTSAISPSDSTVVVRVDSVFASPRSIGFFSSRLVTVVTADTANLVLDKQYLFLAYGLVADSSLVLRQTGRYTVPPALADNIPFVIAKTDSILADTAVKRHVDSADVAVLGRWTADSPATLSATAARFYKGELNPEWWIGTIAIDTVFKPQAGLPPPASPLHVAFRTSRHLVYRRMPRPHVGDTAIYVLRWLSRLPPEERFGLDTMTMYAIDDSLDVVSARNKNRFKLLVIPR